MAARVDNNVYFNGTLLSGGDGPITPTSPVDNTRKLPAQVYADGEVFPLQIEQVATGQSSLVFATLNNSLIDRGVVIDTSARTGALVGLPPYTPPLADITFTQAAVVCGVTIPAQLSVYLDDQGRFAFGSPIRKTIFFQAMTGVAGAVAIADFTQYEAIFVLGIAAANDGGGGVFVYDSTSNAVADGYNIFALTAPGVSGRLIRQRYEIAANFFRDTLGVYADVTGVSRFKLHALARGVAGADAAWSGLKVTRGTDAAGDFTSLEIVDNDRDGGNETPFYRQKSYGDDNDVIEFLKPIAFGAVADKADMVPGQFARSDADEFLWYYDPDRGLSQILLSDGGPRATVSNIAAIRGLKPDGYQDGEVVEVMGGLFQGDGVRFAVYWNSGSAAADDGITVFKPNFHDDGSAWVEPGRFIILAPLRRQTFADADQTPNTTTGVLWRTAAAPPAAGIINLRLLPGQSITIEPNAAACVFKHQANGAAGFLNLPNGADLTLSPGDAALEFYEENGSVYLRGGGSSGNLGTLQATDAEIRDVADPVNTTGKLYGRVVLDTTNSRLLFALGSAAADNWRPFDDQTGTSDVPPL